MRLYDKIHNGLDYSSPYSLSKAMGILHSEFDSTSNIAYAKDIINTLNLIYKNYKLQYGNNITDYSRRKISNNMFLLLDYMTKGMKQKFNYKIEGSLNET